MNLSLSELLLQKFLSLLWLGNFLPHARQTRISLLKRAIAVDLIYMWSFVKIGIFHEPFSILYHYWFKVSSDFIKILLQYLIKNHLTSYWLCGKINTLYNILTFLNNKNGSLDRLKSEWYYRGVNRAKPIHKPNFETFNI